MIFALLFQRKPRSFNKGPHRSFQTELRDEALRRFAGRTPLEGDLYVRIVWFHREPTTTDVDNIAKNILDALKGAVFRDDVTVTQCLACKIHMSASPIIEDRGAPAGIQDELLPLLEPGGPANVLYVEVGALAGNRVVLGPIDGGVA